eukprot:6194213-Pleurochrysis_carterae.AAC.2
MTRVAQMKRTVSVNHLVHTPARQIERLRTPSLPGTSLQASHHARAAFVEFLLAHIEDAGCVTTVAASQIACEQEQVMFAVASAGRCAHYVRNKAATITMPHRAWPRA